MPSTGITFPKQIANQKASALHANATVTALVVHSVDADGNYVSPGAGSTQVSIRDILTSSNASVMDSTNNAIGVTIRAGSAAGTEYTDGDVDATISGGAILFGNGSNTMRPVTATRGLPVNMIAGSLTGTVTTQPTFSDVGAQTVGALNDAAVTSNGVAAFYIPSGLTGTISFERSADGVSGWVAEGAWLTDGTYATSVSSFPATGTLQLYGFHRLRVSAYTSGSADILLSYFLQPIIPVGQYVRGTVTVQQSTATDLLARVNQGVGNSSGGDAWRFATVDSSNATVKPGDGVNNAVRVNVVAGAAGGSTQVSVKDILTSSNASVMDSTNTAIRVNVVAGSAAGSTEVTVRQSTYADFNGLFRLADRDASTAVAAILGSAPASTSYGLVTRDLSTGPYVVSSVGGVVNVSTGPFVISSVGGVVSVSTGPLLGRVTDRDASTAVAAVLGSAPVSTTYGLVTRDLSTGPYVVSSVGGVVQVSTGPFVISSVGGVVAVSTGPFAISSIAGPVIVRSSAADAAVTATIGTNLQSTVAPSSGSSGLVVRQVIDAIQSTGSTSWFGGGGNSTSFTLQSSAANLRAYVTAYSFTSTNQTPYIIGFYSSGNLIAPIRLAAISSAFGGANLAVAPPGYLFRTEASAALSIRIDQSSRTGDVGWVSWFVAP